MTHIESFNANPLAGVEYRSTTGSIKTKTPDLYFGGGLPNLASLTNEFSIVHSYGHKDSNHGSAQHLALTGEKVIGDNPQFWASYGSVVSGIYGKNTDIGLPTYIKLNAHKHTGGGWMGSPYSGYDRVPEGVGDLSIRLSPERFNQRINTLKLIESGFNTKLGQQYTEIRNQAIDVLLGDASKAFKIEDDKEYASYKGSSFAQDCLSSIRLVEAGAKFVFLSVGGWDMHNDISNSLKTKHAELDTYLSKMILSLKARGLSNVMLVVTSEFGRTSRLNQTAGRDHQATIAPLLLLSNNHKGTVIGKSNIEANEIVENPFTPADLGATILHHMGINKGTSWTSVENRPMPLVSSTSKIIC